MDVLSFEEMSLGQLFTAASEVGSKYQTQEENEEYSAKLDGVVDSIIAELSNEDYEFWLELQTVSRNSTN